MNERRNFNDIAAVVLISALLLVCLLVGGGFVAFRAYRAQTRAVVEARRAEIAQRQVALAMQNFAAAPTKQEDDTSYLRVQDGRFVDGEGRQVILHGLNVISKSKDENYLSWHQSEDFAKLYLWGMNCVRLGIIWDGIEPEPGTFDDAYLDGVEERVKWASAHGIHVFLDMHQDLYSVLYSDGAPAWATLSEGEPHVTGNVWSDAYLISPAVQVAFDNFWANTPASDGVGVQDHYAAAWRHVAKRFAANPAVIGYDLMNEPFEGSSVVAAQAALVKGEFGRLLKDRLGDVVNVPEEIPGLWAEPDGRQLITGLLEDITLYRVFVDAQEEHSQKFERQQLQAMYQRVAHAIRSVDPHHILLLETSYHCNAGVKSAVEPVTGNDGNRDSLQAYAPHAYDIVVDTPALANADTPRVELIFSRHGETATRLRMPMIIGEWGALGNADQQILPSARILQQQFETLLCGDTYWDYDRALERRPHFATLKRSIPNRIAGVLLQYSSEPDTNTFTCRWREMEHITAPSIIYLTEATLHGRTARLEPWGAGFQLSPVASGSGDSYISIPPTGESIVRTLTVR